ncbi:MAG: PaaX family transcriptional regulator C-terminal domain-containing protein [Maritimibacter sp.]
MSGARAISALIEAGEPRVWSLIVTVFGDMARAPGATIPGPVLSALTSRMGIRPEAMRVALYRLRKDDWITSTKAGRVSQYHLTQAGRRQSERATARIYAAFPPAPADWHVFVAPPMEHSARLAVESDFGAKGYVTLAPGTFLGTGPAPERAGYFAMTGQPGHLPDWLKSQLMPEELAQAYEAFLAVLSEVELALREGKTCALDRAAIRILIVHGWRRLVLRHTPLPDALYPSTWVGPEARAKVQDLLATLGRPLVSDLSEDAALIPK